LHKPHHFCNSALHKELCWFWGIVNILFHRRECLFSAFQPTQQAANPI
jgi:hypothetical protein